MRIVITFLLLISLQLIVTSKANAGGVVYLVIGSDTAIWAGMNTAMLKNFYDVDLYPNPFNPSTTIRFQIPTSTHVKIEVFNLIGERIIKLVDQHLTAGAHYTVWNGRRDSGKLVSSGSYFYRI